MLNDPVMVRGGKTCQFFLGGPDQRNSVGHHLRFRALWAR
jgi:hypothetical protein